MIGHFMGFRHLYKVETNSMIMKLKTEDTAEISPPRNKQTDKQTNTKK